MSHLFQTDSTNFNRYYRLLYKNNGYTLLEMIIVMAFLGIILTGVLSFLYFGSSTYFTGKEKVFLQSNLRMASEVIDRELRYASTITLLDNWADLPSSPGEVTPGNNYIYYNQDNKTIFLLDANQNRALTEPVITDVNFYIENNRSFHFKLKAEDKHANYSLESSFNLLNAVHPVYGGNPLPAVLYTKP